MLYEVKKINLDEFAFLFDDKKTTIDRIVLDIYPCCCNQILDCELLDHFKTNNHNSVYMKRVINFCLTNKNICEWFNDFYKK
jgi:hypothetical protein